VRSHRWAENGSRPAQTARPPLAVDQSGHYLNLPKSKSAPPMPTDEWSRTIHNLHEQLINGRKGTMLNAY
jgi:hypothetical protein